MVYKPIENAIIPQAIADTSTTQKLPLGTIIRAADPTYGVGEFIYLKGVANTLANSWVRYLPDDFTTALLVAGHRGSVAIAMSANVASQYGWYQIQGKGVGKVLAAFADDGAIYATATAGSVDDAVVAGDRVRGALGASAIDTPSAGLAEIELSRPWIDASGLADIPAGALSADATGRAMMADGFFNAATVDLKVATDAVGEDRLTAAELTGRVMAVNATSNVIGSIPVLHRVLAAALTGDVDVVLTHKTRVIDVACVGTAAGGAGDTITVKNGATAITDAIDMNVADAVVKRAGTIDDAQHEIAAGGTLRVTGASAVNAIVYVYGLRVA